MVRPATLHDERKGPSRLNKLPLDRKGCDQAQLFCKEAIHVNVHSPVKEPRRMKWEEGTPFEDRLEKRKRHIANNTLSVIDTGYES